MECRYDDLSAALSADEILRVTGEYLATWSNAEMACLPATCRPASVKTCDDIEFWADRLKDESDKAALVIEDEAKLDRLTTHFLIASVRLRQVVPAF